MRSMVCAQCHVEYTSRARRSASRSLAQRPEDRARWRRTTTRRDGRIGSTRSPARRCSRRSTRVRAVEPGHPRAQRRRAAPTATCRIAEKGR
jgi:formate-dependent nitrite reductase cytochrome c552 subunit